MIMGLMTHSTEYNKQQMHDALKTITPNPNPIEKMQGGEGAPIGEDPRMEVEIAKQKRKAEEEAAATASSKSKA